MSVEGSKTRSRPVRAYVSSHQLGTYRRRSNRYRLQAGGRLGLYCRRWRSEGAKQPVCDNRIVGQQKPHPKRTAMQRFAFLALTLAMTAAAAVSKGNADNYPSRSI